jgi:hypothetical protein
MLGRSLFSDYGNFRRDAFFVNVVKVEPNTPADEPERDKLQSPLRETDPTEKCGNHFASASLESRITIQ